MHQFVQPSELLVGCAPRRRVADIAEGIRLTDTRRKGGIARYGWLSPCDPGLAIRGHALEPRVTRSSGVQNIRAAGRLNSLGASTQEDRHDRSDSPHDDGRGECAGGFIEVLLGARANGLDAERDEVGDDILHRPPDEEGAHKEQPDVDDLAHPEKVRSRPDDDGAGGDRQIGRRDEGIDLRAQRWRWGPSVGMIRPQ